MKKLGEFTKGDRLHYVFWNEENQTLNYFYTSNLFENVQCWTISVSNVKYIVPQFSSVEKAKINYEVIWSVLTNMKPNKVEKLVEMQWFDRELWNKAIETNFENFTVEEFKYKF